nr:TetR/AcrR family transcriptional regulator C-terminal domain-containing protein [Streptomyces sulphureus]
MHHLLTAPTYPAAVRNAICRTALALHAPAPLPTPDDDRRHRLPDNSFRRTLLLRRDGARFHTGSTPAGDLGRMHHKMNFLLTSGATERDARTAMLAAGRFTIGSVLEGQADAGSGNDSAPQADMPAIDHESVFAAGPTLIPDGLVHRTAMWGRPQRSPTWPGDRKGRPSHETDYWPHKKDPWWRTRFTSGRVSTDR